MQLGKIVLQHNLANPNDFGFSPIGRTYEGFFVGVISLDTYLGTETDAMGWVTFTPLMREYSYIPVYTGGYFTPSAYDKMRGHTSENIIKDLGAPHKESLEIPILEKYISGDKKIRY